MSDTYANPTGIAWNGHVGVAQYGGGDGNLVCMFYYKPTHQIARSAEEGRPIYEDVVFVRIHPPGERLNIVDRPATEQDKRRFRIQYEAFLKNQVQTPDGTPIDLFYPDQPSIAAMLRAHHVLTIEQLAELSGNAIDEIGMGAQRYVNEAIEYLKIANKGISATQMRRELEERDREIRVQAKQIQDLQSTVQMLQKQAAAAQNLGQVQEMIAGVMGRPVHSQRGFDPQSAMINANHQTQQQRPTPQSKKVGRQRAVIKK